MIKSQVGIEREDAKSSNDPLKLEYEDYLRNQRGLSERTIYHCWRFADRFLQFRSEARRVTCIKLRPRTLCGSCSNWCHEENRFATRRRPRICETSSGSSSRAERPTSISRRPSHAWRKNMHQDCRGTLHRSRWNANRRRESEHRHGATQLCHDTTFGSAWVARS
jgi:hypothetical protein